MNNSRAWLFSGLIVFLSALLSFSLQPMTGRILMPLVGGAPMGWLVTLFFFQTAFLAGYALAHGLSRHHAKGPVFFAVVLIAGGLLAARFAPAPHSLTEPLPLLIHLALTVGMQTIGLAMIGPGVQAMVAQSTISQAENPYPLYAISNMGSFIGLLGYPLLAEPFIDLSTQGMAWAVLAGVLCIALVVTGMRTHIYSDTHTTAHEATQPAVSLSQCLGWVVCAALPSALIGALTLTLTNEIASFPFLWVVPLSLYLATFIIAFSKWFAPGNIVMLCLHGISVAAVMTIWAAPYAKAFVQIQENWDFFFWCIAFFFACLVMHAHLSATRPAPQKITLFYLMIAIGGSIGGGFAAFVAPAVLNDTFEFYALVVLTLLFNPAARITAPWTAKDLKSNRQLWFIYAVCIAVCIYLVHIFTLTWGNPLAFVAMLPISIGVAFMLFFLSVRPRFLSALLLVVFIVCVPMPPRHTQVLETRRNFFGVLRVMDDTNQVILMHGSTRHGGEPHNNAYRGVPVSYYGLNSPVGRIIKENAGGDIAVIGLGSGQMACYATPQRRIHFYEIDPDVIDLARKHFSYLTDCPEASMIVGDGRLALAASRETYDVIVLDAFTSDSVPLHLLTREAVQSYLEHLKPGGALAFHISNRYFSFQYPLAQIAAEMGLKQGYEYYIPTGNEKYVEGASMWFFMTPDAALAQKLEKAGMAPVEPRGRLWTDGYNNLLSILK